MRPDNVQMGAVTIRAADGPFRLLRRGGRNRDAWRERWSGESVETARTQYNNTRGTMRQGGVRLVRRDGSTVVEDWAPRARSRW